jgi:hypothetical protein
MKLIEFNCLGISGVLSLRMIMTLVIIINVFSVKEVSKTH